MTTLSRQLFVQVGATRDGLDPYVTAARGHSLTCVLVETPAYLAWRRRLDRLPFSLELGIPDPANAVSVARALADLRPPIALVLPGFERYAASAYAAAATLHVRPQRLGRDRPFCVPDKALQRALLEERRPAVRQPRHVVVSTGEIASAADALPYPIVVKPTDGGGGLGVFVAEGPEERARALARIRRMTNYGGGSFARIIAEEFVEGVEYSLQGVAFSGRASLLTWCEKIIARERSTDPEQLTGTREAAHIARSASQAPAEFAELAQACVDAFDYADGPFHIDFIQNAQGCHFVEMGFRLSGGGIVALVERVTGLSWAEVALAAHLGGQQPTPKATLAGAVGQALLLDETQLATAESLRRRGVPAEVQRLTRLRNDDDDDPSLASDRLRHAGGVARLIVHGDSAEEVRGHLLSCLTSRGDA